MQYEVKSFRKDESDKKPYIVEAHEQGKRWTCTCPHWLFRLKKSGGRCKHIDYVIKMIAANERAQAEIAADFAAGRIEWDKEVVKPDLFNDDTEAS